MQREHISIPKIVLYVLFAIVIFALQTGTFGALRIFGWRIDLLPALVASAALLGGPTEGAVVGVTVGVLYDIGLVGIDGLYPLFFLLFGYAAGKISRLMFRRSYVSTLILTAAETVTIGLLRYFFSLMRTGATFLGALRQIAGGTVLTCLFCFIVYLPMRKITRKFANW